MKRILMAVLALLFAWTHSARAQPFAVNDTLPAIERWMYPFNGAPCNRPAGSVFGTLADDSGVDSRHGQHLLGWDTAAWIATNRGPAAYLVRRCRLTLTINSGDAFAIDPTADGFRTYFETNHPDYEPDADAGRPIELFGAVFRNGFNTVSFEQCTPFGSAATGGRNAYAAGWSTNGTLVDVGNNVGKTNAAFPPFEVAPFAIGQTTNAAPGELVPAGAILAFDLNLSDPFVLAYVQQALNAGRLRLMITSLFESEGQFGGTKFPEFATHFNQATIDPTRIELEGIAMRDTDVDADGLPDDWEEFHFNDLAQTAANDPDNDGASNQAEFVAGTDPTQAASVLSVTVTNESGANQMMLRWPHTANRTYAIDFSDDSFLSWQTVANPTLLFPEPGIAQWRDESTPSPTARFYRVTAREVGPSEPAP